MERPGMPALLFATVENETRQPKPAFEVAKKGGRGAAVAPLS
jgi:hypothetical protein